MKFRLQACCFWIALSLFPLTSGGDEGNGELRERIAAAYLASEDVLRESARLQAEGFAPGEVEMVDLGGLCGVAGCDSTFLVVRTFTRPGVNPQTLSVPALVTVRLTHGETGPVRLAEIVPREPGPEPLSGKSPSPRLRVERKISAPSPQLRVERKIPAPAPQLRRIDP